MGLLDEEVLRCEEDGARVVEDLAIRVLVGVWIGESVLVLRLELEMGELSEVLVLAWICETGAEIISGAAATGVALSVA